MDRHDLYELCVQSPGDAVRFLHALHGNDPKALVEDFCGTGALSRAWTATASRAALGRDIDPAIVERARMATAPTARRRARFEVRDVIEQPGGSGGDQPDIVFVGNFSIGEIHDRARLVRYLAGARERLGPGGVFVCDTYGGESAFRIGAVTRRHHAADGSVVHYTWEHRRADPATGMVENAIHFRVVRAGEVVAEFPDAFVYRWRLWSVPELRDAMAEAGFATTSVHSALTGDAGEALGADFIVCVCARR
jgi:SAM-dependent methyltransferase